MPSKSSTWININECGLPPDEIEAAAKRCELVAHRIGESLYVERHELRRWLQTTQIPPAASAPTDDGEKFLGLFFFPEALKRRQNPNVGITGYDTPQPPKLGLRARPTSARARFDNGYYTAWLRMPNDSFVYVEMTDATGRPRFTECSPSTKEQRAALADALAKLMLVEYEY